MSLEKGFLCGWFVEILSDYPQEIISNSIFIIVANSHSPDHCRVEFGLRIEVHRIQKPSGGWIRPTGKPSGGRVQRATGLRARAWRVGKRGEGRVGGPGRHSVERPEGPRLRAVGPAGREVERRNGRQAGKPSGGPARRGRDLRMALVDGPGRAEMDRPTDRDALGWNGSEGGDLRIAPADESRRARTERSTGSRCFRAAGPMGWGSSGHRINGRNGRNGSVQETSGGLLGVHCKDPASRHLASPLIWAPALQFLATGSRPRRGTQSTPHGRHRYDA